MPASSLFTGFSSIVRGANPSTRDRSTASLIVGLHTLHLPTSNNRARFVMPIHTQHYRWRSIRPSSSLCPFHRFREHADHALPTIEYRWSFSFRWRMCPVQDGRWRLNTLCFKLPTQVANSAKHRPSLPPSGTSRCASIFVTKVPVRSTALQLHTLRISADRSDLLQVIHDRLVQRAPLLPVAVAPPIQVPVG